MDGKRRETAVALRLSDFLEQAPPLSFQPVPYQGSKRRLAPLILSLFPRHVRTLHEPFAGSAAVTLAAARYAKAGAFRINDSLVPLAAIWRAIVDDPTALADAYERIWSRQVEEDPAAVYREVRETFDATRDPACLLFLLARCTKNAVRFNRRGGFSQSADPRRLGTRPARMRKALFAAHRLLAGHTTVSALDYAEALEEAGPEDLVYLDPPYLGVSGGKNPRYHQQLDYDRFVATLEGLRRRGVPFVVSFDGRCGNRRYGPGLPPDLGLAVYEVATGRSAQATLLGRSDETVETLWVTPDLAARGP